MAARKAASAIQMGKGILVMNLSWDTQYINLSLIYQSPPIWIVTLVTNSLEIKNGLREEARCDGYGNALKLPT
ncbi:MAG: hypothetical protein JETCAE02_16610 [Anaerolineaceae bacterium]|nr:MAG: hypothetical protein BroJett001_09930 [Chloroflexota bacterium]GJQ39249.1 MAG: hypothetical protein JETCAE02_16610 [Anaerolineaceae bacterium]